MVALNEKPSTPELAELDSPSSGNLFEHDEPLSRLTKDLLRGQQLGISNQPLHALRLMGPEFDPNRSLQSDPNEDDSPEAMSMSSGPDDTPTLLPCLLDQMAALLPCLLGQVLSLLPFGRRDP